MTVHRVETDRGVIMINSGTQIEARHRIPNCIKVIGITSHELPAISKAEAKRCKRAGDKLRDLEE